jgi:hypothetical protein
MLVAAAVVLMLIEKQTLRVQAELVAVELVAEQL